MPRRSEVRIVFIGDAGVGDVPAIGDGVKTVLNLVGTAADLNRAVSDLSEGRSGPVVFPFD